MAATSRRTTSGCGPVIRSAPPAGRFQSTKFSSASAFASSTSSFSSRSSTFLNRAASPPRLSVATAAPSAQSVRFSFDRPTSPSRSISVSPRVTGGHHHHNTAVKSGRNISQPKRTCMCSPTTHPGSFRCSLHKNNSHVTASAPYSQNRLNARRSAMTNSLVRIGGVEGDLVRRALSALIRPSSHSQRRRADFRPRPSRLSTMSNAQIKFEIKRWHSLKFGFAFRSNSSPSPFHRYPFCDQQRVYSVSFDAFRLSVSARSFRSLRLSRCIYFSPGFTPNIEKLNFGGIENFEAINAQKFRNPNLEGLDGRNFINLIN